MYMYSECCRLVLFRYEQCSHRIWKQGSQGLPRVELRSQHHDHNNCRLLCHLLVILKVIFATSVEQSDLDPHCLPVCKNRFEKFARIFSRQHKQTTFSDAGFLGILRVKEDSGFIVWKRLNIVFVSLGGSVGCTFRLETRRSRVQPRPRSATFFRGDWSWNIFYGHSLPSADTRRAVVSFWWKNMHNTG